MSDIPTRNPTFNHVAMSVPTDLLEPSGRRKLLDFYCYQLPMMVEVQCFDWAVGLGADSIPDSTHEMNHRKSGQ